MTDTQQTEAPVDRIQAEVLGEVRNDSKRYGFRSEPLPPRDRSQLPGVPRGHGGSEPAIQDRDLHEFTGLATPERVERLREASRDLTDAARQLEREHYQYRHAESRDFATEDGRTAILNEHRAQSQPVEDGAMATYREADRIIRAAERIARLAQNARDSQAGLSDAEYQSASARREFFREDAASLPLPELADRVRAAVVTNDWPSLYLWTRLVPERLTRAQATNAMTDAGQVAFPADPRQLAQVRQALAEAEQKLASKPKPAVARTTFDAELAAAQQAAARVGKILNDRPGVSTVGRTVDGRQKVAW